MSSMAKLFRVLGLRSNDITTASSSDDDQATQLVVILVAVVAVLIGVWFQTRGSFNATSSEPTNDNTTAPNDKKDMNTKDKITTSSINITPLDSNDSSTNDSTSAVRKAALGTVWSIAVKLLSFLCTQQAFRLLDNNIAALGRAAIQLELLLTTILFISREGFRLSLTKGDASSKDNWNVAWLSIPVSVVTSTLALSWHLFYSTTPQDKVGDVDVDYRLGGILYCAAALMEGLAEPAALHALRRMEVATRVSAEGIASLCKTLVTVIALRQWLPDWPIFSFGVAQLAYALVYTGFLYGKTWRKLQWPNMATGFDTSTCYMTFLFMVQGMFKHFLTEANQIILSTLAGAYDPGIYGMTSAYAGLATRFLLQIYGRDGTIALDSIVG